MAPIWCRRLTVYDVFYAVARDHPELLTPGTAPKELANDLLPKKNLPLALKSGVKIAYGTDIGEGDHAMEFALLDRQRHESACRRSSPPRATPPI